jgi:cyclin C
MLTHDGSHRDVGQTLDPAPEGHRDRDGLFQAVLRQKPVLRDGPIYRDSRLLLRRCESRGIAGPHKECRLRIAYHVQPYVPCRFLISCVAAHSTARAEEGYGIKNFPSDNSKLAEMEFYLVSDLECDLVVFHPYRTLLTLCGRETAYAFDTEAGEVGVGIDNGPRYWGTGEGRLELEEGPLQTAWYVASLPSPTPSHFNRNRFIINDTYRSEICLLYPPHMIAIAAIYLTLVLNDKTREAVQAQAAPVPPPRRSSRTTSGSAHRKSAPAQQQDFVGFMAGLNVSLPTIAMIAQEILSLYTLWGRYSDTPPESGLGASGAGECSGDDVVTPAFLTQLLLRMRESRLADLAHPASGQPVAVNKRLERTQAAG